MSRKEAFARNVLSSTTGVTVNIAVALLLAPFIVGTLGVETYGVWALVVSLTGQYGVLDLGVRSAVSQYVARYLALDDREGVNRTVSTSFFLLCGMTVVGLAVTAGIAGTIHLWDSIPAADVPDARIAMLVTGSSVALTFPLMVFAASIYAARRMDIDQGLGIVERLLSVGLTVVLLRSGWRLTGLALATNPLSVLFNLLRAFLCFRVVPGLRVTLSRFSRESLREICGFGFFNFVVNAAERVFVYAGTLVIGIFLSAAAITYYSIAANLIPYFMALITAVLWTLTPYATTCDARGDREALRALLLKGTRGTLLLASIVGGGLIFLGRDFIRVWMGERFVSGETYPSSAVILGLLAISGLVRSFEGCGRQILLGMRRVRLLAMLAILEVALNLLVSSLLVGPLGILGVALGTLLPLLLTQGFLTSYFVVRLLGVDWRDLARSAIRGCVPALAAMAASWLLFDPLLHPAGWPGFLLKAVLIALPAPIVGWAVTLRREERELVLRRVFPARRGSEA